MGNEHKDNESGIEHPISVLIPPECIDPDGAPCEHDNKKKKTDYNPV